MRNWAWRGGNVIRPNAEAALEARRRKVEGALQAETNEERQEALRQQLEGIEVSMAQEAERHGRKEDAHELRARVLELQAGQTMRREERETDEVAKAGLRERAERLRREAEEWRWRGARNEGASGGAEGDEEGDKQGDEQDENEGGSGEDGKVTKRKRNQDEIQNRQAEGYGERGARGAVRKRQRDEVADEVNEKMGEGTRERGHEAAAAGGACSAAEGSESLRREGRAYVQVAGLLALCRLSY